REEGRGGMGVVYLARQTDLDRVVALKMILSSQLASEQEIRRFYQEAKAAGSIRHPNIVGIHEVGEIGGQHYFTMDYVEGQDLAALLRDGAIDPDRAAELVCQIARAVQFLHDHGLVHRDLKPSNILIDEAGTAFVTDFGLAKTFGDSGEHTRTGTILGTPSYMAPEQAAGKTSQVGPPSDVYSLGAILYELLTGRPPFKKDKPLDTLVEVIEGEPTLLRKVNRSVPRDLELICLQCLEKEPQSRYSSAGALAEDLGRFLRRESVEARPSGLWQRVRRWSRREPALVMHLGGILAAAAVIQVRHMAVGADPEYHWAIMVRLGVWAVVAFIFQKMLNVDRLVQFTRYAWSAADVILFTSLLFVADQPVGTLLGAYALLIAASGLFFQVRLVWFTTFTALASYTALILLQPDPNEPRHYPIIFGTVLAVLGFVVAYQVYRVRVLSRYYDGRRS
ncbi:MAG: serine/threonine-protein kinase, partial [Planctomycetaceae bacterium]